MQCPLCSTPLELLRLGGLPIDRCQPCGVFWFDRLELEAFLSMVTRLDSRRRPAKIELPSRATCPRCRTRTLESGSWRDIPMARCSQCRGLLLGDGGLRAVQDKWGRHSKRAQQFHWPDAFTSQEHLEEALSQMAHSLMAEGEE